MKTPPVPEGRAGRRSGRPSRRRSRCWRRGGSRPAAIAADTSAWPAVPWSLTVATTPASSISRTQATAWSRLAPSSQVWTSMQAPLAPPRGVERLGRGLEGERLVLQRDDRRLEDRHQADRPAAAAPRRTGRRPTARSPRSRSPWPRSAPAPASPSSPPPPSSLSPHAAATSTSGRTTATSRNTSFPIWSPLRAGAAVRSGTVHQERTQFYIGGPLLSRRRNGSGVAS